MNLSPVTLEEIAAPEALRPHLENARLYDSSCSPGARVTFVDKDDGYFLKAAPRATLDRECALTRYFNGKGLAARVIAYAVEDEGGWLLTEKVPGNDCTAQCHLAEPERLCDTLAERLSLLHALGHEHCPVADHTERYLNTVEKNHRQQRFDPTVFPTQDWGFSTPEEAYAIVQKKGRLLETNTLLHGDYCLPNVVLDDWRFSGFVDLDSGGVGDRHIDLFWATWTLTFNLKTDRLRARFLDAYGRDRVDDERLQLVAACEVFQ